MQRGIHHSDECRKRIEAAISRDNPSRSQYHEVRTNEQLVHIDRLVPPLDTKLGTAQADPLRSGYEPHMPREPRFDFEAHARRLMFNALSLTKSSLACATAPTADDKVEVVYIPEAGPENGQGVIQCRAKLNVPPGTLRLYPIGGNEAF